MDWQQMQIYHQAKCQDFNEPLLKILAFFFAFKHAELRLWWHTALADPNLQHFHQVVRIRPLNWLRRWRRLLWLAKWSVRSQLAALEEVTAVQLRMKQPRLCVPLKYRNLKYDLCWQLTAFYTPIPWFMELSSCSVKQQVPPFFHSVFFFFSIFLVLSPWMLHLRHGYTHTHTYEWCWERSGPSSLISTCPLLETVALH